MTLYFTVLNQKQHDGKLIPHACRLTTAISTFAKHEYKKHHNENDGVCANIKCKENCFFTSYSLETNSELVRPLQIDFLFPVGRPHPFYWPCLKSHYSVYNGSLVRNLIVTRVLRDSYKHAGQRERLWSMLLQIYPALDYFWRRRWQSLLEWLLPARNNSWLRTGRGTWTSGSSCTALEL